MGEIIGFIAEQVDQLFWVETVLDLDLRHLYALMQTSKDQEAKTRGFLFLQAADHDISRKGQFV